MIEYFRLSHYIAPSTTSKSWVNSNIYKVFSRPLQIHNNNWLLSPILTHRTRNQTKFTLNHLKKILQVSIKFYSKLLKTFCLFSLNFSEWKNVALFNFARKWEVAERRRFKLNCFENSYGGCRLTNEGQKNTANMVIRWHLLTYLYTGT